MRIIFSRKGFDSASGGCPSPIIDGRPISLPIPSGPTPASETPTCHRYADLHGDFDYGGLVEELTNGKKSRFDHCHLDPDLDQSLLPRQPGWRGAFGQIGPAQSHLQKQALTHGDLFLFWGLFRPAEHRTRWKFDRHAYPEHRLFGWLQIDEIVSLGADGWQVALASRPWLQDHPHVRSGWLRQNNTLYIATTHLHLKNQRELNAPGWGVFKRGLRLTATGSTPSTWAVPDWLNPKRGGVGMTYHAGDRWSLAGTLQSVGRGQEFVSLISNRADALTWLDHLFDEVQ
jgi:hypothetical protein